MSSHADANKNTWSKIPFEKRQERMANASKARWANKSPEEKTAHALKMVEGRKAKKAIGNQ